MVKKTKKNKSSAAERECMILSELDILQQSNAAIYEHPFATHENIFFLKTHDELRHESFADILLHAYLSYLIMLDQRVSHAELSSSIHLFIKRAPTAECA